MHVKFAHVPTVELQVQYCARNTFLHNYFYLLHLFFLQHISRAVNLPFSWQQPPLVNLIMLHGNTGLNRRSGNEVYLLPKQMEEERLGYYISHDEQTTGYLCVLIYILQIQSND